MDAILIFPLTSASPGEKPKTVKKANSCDAIRGVPDPCSFQLLYSNTQDLIIADDIESLQTQRNRTHRSKLLTEDLSKILRKDSSDTWAGDQFSPAL